MNTVLFLVVIFGAVLLHSTVGFGSAILAMALLPQLVGLTVAAPLVALVAATLEIVILLHHPTPLDWRAIRLLGSGMFVGVPIGVWILSQVDAGVLLPVLGGVILVYALYGLGQWRLPELHARGWAFVAGLLAGVLGGAYNTSGPPVIVYGNCRRWSPTEFRKNLQAFFLVGDALVIAAHAAAGNVTREVWHYYLLALPVLACAAVAGFAIARFIPPAAFRKLALIILLALGARLCVG